MRLKTQRKVIYATMGLTVLALIGGFGLANLQLGSTNTVQQGSLVTTISPVPGLSWNSTTLLGLQSPVFNTTCSAAHPCNITSASAGDCAGGWIPGDYGCMTGNWVEQIVLSTVPGSHFIGMLGLTVYVTISGTTYPGITYYYTEGSGNNLQTVTLDFDLGSSPANVTSITLVANT
jgi:hypothetical protein